MPADRIALGYNAVDNAFYRTAPTRGGATPDGRDGLARGPVLPLGLPLRPREEPAPADRGVRAVIATSPSPANGAGTWSSAATAPRRPDRGGDRAQRPRRARSTGRASSRPSCSSRWYAHAGGLRAPQPLRALGPGRQRGRRTGLPLLVSDRAGCATTLSRSRREQPAPGSTRSTSRR